VTPLLVEAREHLSTSEAAEVDRLLGGIDTLAARGTIGEGKRGSLDADAVEGSTVLLARDGQGHLVGFASLQRHPASFGVEIVDSGTDPGEPVTRALLRRAGQEVERRGGGALFYWVHEAGDAEPAVATAEGFTLDRELFEMRTPLPLQSDIVDAARPIVTRPFVPGVDEEAWLEVNNRAFAGHPEQSGWDMADLRAREAEPWFDPHGLLLLELEGRLAGSCWTKVHEEVDPHEGEIFVIAVDPDFEHQGLGRALTVAGYAYLAGLGLTEGILYVDAANPAAVTLYRSLGLEVVRVDRAYVRTMPNQP